MKKIRKITCLIEQVTEGMESFFGGGDGIFEVMVTLKGDRPVNK